VTWLRRGLGLVLVAALALVWWWFAAGRGPLVSAVTPTRGPVAEIVYATGAVEPLHWARVTAQVRERIVWICDCEGKSVVEGEVLARLDDKEARAQLAEAKARTEFVEREMSRIVDLYNRGSSTVQAYERALSELRQAQSVVQAKQERLDDFRVVAPIDGMVLRRDGEIGEMAETGQIMFRIGPPRPLQIVSEVNEEDIPRIALGQTVLLRADAFTETRLEGKVREITPAGDPTTKTFRVRIGLPEETPLRIGMSVEANIIAREKADAMVVPAEAVIGGHVFVLDGTHLRRRAIRIGLRGTRAVEVLEGLQPTERIVSPAPSGLIDGMRVRVAP
jgi:RND family efflux transporter MFP subunit